MFWVCCEGEARFDLHTKKRQMVVKTIIITMVFTSTIQKIIDKNSIVW